MVKKNLVGHFCSLSILRLAVVVNTNCSYICTWRTGEMRVLLCIYLNPIVCQNCCLIRLTVFFLKPHSHQDLLICTQCLSVGGHYSTYLGIMCRLSQYISIELLLRLKKKIKWCLLL